MAKKKVKPSETETEPMPKEEPAQTLSNEKSELDTTPSDEVIKVKVQNISDLKNACDDAVKEYFARPGHFTRSYRHTDIRLALGWTAVIIGTSGSLYGYAVPFHESKLIVAIAVAIYALLASLLALYITYVEGDNIFLGNRKTFVNSRIQLESLTVDSTISPIPSFPIFPWSRPDPLALTPCPSYSLKTTYKCVNNVGNTLIRQQEIKLEKPFNAFFDENGVFHKTLFEKELETVQMAAVG